jgi:hypothetical protein
MARAWALGGGLLLGLILLLCVVWAVMDHLRLVSLASAAVVAGAFLVGLAFVMVACFRIIGNADRPPEIREARADGIAATGTVLAVEKTGWKTRRGRGTSLTFGPTRWECSIRLRVTRPDLPDYEAEAVESLTSDQFPERGAVVPIRVHPRRPEVVVLDLPRA